MGAAGALLPAMTPKRGGRWRITARSSTASCSGPAPGSPGGTCPSATGHGRRSTSGSPAGRPMAPGPASRPSLHILADDAGSWTGTPRSTPARSAPTSTPPAPVKGAPLDPGKPPASVGTVTGWADHRGAPHRRRPGPQPGHPADPGAGMPTPASWWGWWTPCGWPARVAGADRGPGWPIRSGIRPTAVGPIGRRCGLAGSGTPLPSATTRRPTGPARGPWRPPAGL
jgi:hypothetical protein